MSLLLLLSTSVLLAINFEVLESNFQNDDKAIFIDSTAQTNTLGEFLGINSVRESNSHRLNDQYTVSRFHRIFGMDSHVFTGEEMVREWKGKYAKIDLNIPHAAYPDDQLGFNPAKGAGGFNFDQFLEEMKNNGLISIPVLAKNLLYNNVPEDSMINVWQIPWDEGADPENPMDYKAYASFLFQFTARYGKNKLISEGGTINPSLLKLIATNEVKAGLDLVFAIEPGNEMDKDWFTRREMATPKIMAAFLSAALDGHMGLMGDGHGILSADPTMKVLFPSPIDIKSDFILEVIDEMVKLRSEAETYNHKIIPEENLILTAHAYPFKTSSTYSNEESAIVEETELFKKSQNFLKKLRAKYNCPIYLTETGYDKVIGRISPVGAPAIDTDIMDSPEISTYAQAKHLTRLLMLMYSAGYDKTFIFTLKDPVAVGAWGFRRKFSTSGLTRKNGKKDHVWYIIDFLSHELANYKFEYALFENNTYIIKLQNGPKMAFIYWMGTNKNVSINYSLALPNNCKNFSFVDFSDCNEGFSIIPKESSASDIMEIEVSEFPKILFLE